MSEQAVPLIFRERVNYTITTGATGLHVKSDIPAEQLISILTNPYRSQT